MRRAGWGLVGSMCFAVGVMAFAASRSRADEPAAERVTTLERLEAPATCPTRAAVDARILSLAPSASGASVRARVSIVERDGELVATVEIESEGSSALRTLRGHACDALAEVVALVVAMVIDPSAALRAQPTSEPTDAVAPADPAILPDDPVTVDAPRPEPIDAGASSEPIHEVDAAPPDERETPDEAEVTDDEAPQQEPLEVPVLVSVWLVGAAAPLPSPTYGAALVAGVRVMGLEIALGGQVLAESRAQVPGTTRGGDFGFAAGRLRIGYAFDLAPVEIVPVVAVDVGATWGRGFGVTRPSSGNALSVEVAVGAEARWFFIPELGLSLFAELTIPVLRPDFILTGVASTPVFRAGEVGTLFGLGLVARLR